MPSRMKAFFDIDGTSKGLTNLIEIRKFQKMQLDISVKNMEKLEGDYKDVCAANKADEEELNNLLAECKALKVQRRNLQQKLRVQLNRQAEEMSVDSGLEKSQSDYSSFFDNPNNFRDYDDIFGGTSRGSGGASGNQKGNSPDIFGEIGSTNTGRTPSEPSTSQGGRGKSVDKTPTVDENSFLSQRSSTPRGFLGGDQKKTRGKKR